MIFGSVCSGIEAASVAWRPLGWQAAFFSEIEAFPSQVLAHHYGSNLPGKPPSPNGVPNYGDMTRFKDWPDHAIDLLCGGTPCQSFSIAGLRAGLDDPRGNLMLTYFAIAARYRPRWLVWENVPGVLSSFTGPEPPGDLVEGQQWESVETSDFGSFLGGLAELGYGYAYRVLDAQFVRVDGFERAVPQRRRRVFVVGYLGDWRRAAAVLFDRESLRGDPAPRRKSGKNPAPTLSARPSGGGGLGTDFDLDGGLIASTGDISHCLNAGGMGRQDYETETMVVAPVASTLPAGGNDTGGDRQPGTSAETAASMLVAHALRADGFDASEDGTGRGTPLVPMTLAIRGRADGAELEWRQDGTSNAVLTPSGGRGGIGVGAVAHAYRVGGDGDVWDEGDKAAPLTTGTDRNASIVTTAHAIQAGAVRTNPDSGPDGVGVQAEVQAVAYSNGEKHGGTSKADTGEILRGVRDTLGEEAFAQWGLGILDTLQPQEILRSALHGSELRPTQFPNGWLGSIAQCSPQDRAAGAVQSLRCARGERRSPLGREFPEQQSVELGAYLSELSHAAAPASAFMRDLWHAAEGIGFLRQALSAVQKMGRSDDDKDQTGQWAVRRLMPVEAARLQGFPDDYLSSVTHRGKAPADGPMYKALGNSMAVNVMRWIGRRIEMVDKL